MRRLTAMALMVAAATTAVPPAATAASTTVPPAAADSGPVAVEYRSPVEAPVIDRFRPPSKPFGPGNVGIDYATTPGSDVGAAADGKVVFAGPVGAGLHVVVLHADGIRTSASFLATVEVRRGQLVAAGQTLGTSGPSLHFGARAGDAYIDPLVLLGGATGPMVVRLVPDPERVMGDEAAERAGLRRLLGALPGAAARVGATAVGWARDGAVAAGTGVVVSVAEGQARLAAVAPFREPPWWSLASGLQSWWQRSHQCTPASVAPPPPVGRRWVVLVAGLGSTSRSAGIDGVDTAALGYRSADVVRFSYRGGTTDEAPYGATDTQVDIRESGRRLRELLDRLLAADPGVPIDVISHSQGGLVARSALGPRAPPGIGNLITLATPHGGAGLATALDLGAGTPLGALVEGAVSHLGVSAIDPTSTSVRQLSEASGYIREINAAPVPAGIRITSIAGRADVVVPAPRARLRGATNVVVTVTGLNVHGRVPAAPAATREMALALAGMAPTCEEIGDALVDVVAGEAIAAAEDAVGLALLPIAG